MGKNKASFCFQKKNEKKFFAFFFFFRFFHFFLLTPQQKAVWETVRRSWRHPKMERTLSQELLRSSQKERTQIVYFMLVALVSWFIGSLDPYPSFFFYGSFLILLGKLVADLKPRREQQLFQTGCFVYAVLVLWNSYFIFSSLDSTVCSTWLKVLLFLFLWFYFFALGSQILHLTQIRVLDKKTRYHQQFDPPRPRTTINNSFGSPTAQQVLSTISTPATLIKDAILDSIKASTKRPERFSQEDDLLNQQTQRNMESLRAYYETTVLNHGIDYALEVFAQNAIIAADSIPELSGGSSRTMYLSYGSKAFTLSDRQSALAIGRFGGCDVVVNSESVSRVHAIVLFKGDHIVVVDVGSQNGMMLLDSQFSVLQTTSSAHRLNMVVQAQEIILLYLCSFFSSRAVRVVLSTKECMVCQEFPRNCRVHPCLHWPTCLSCSQSLTECPLCRCPINRVEEG